MAERMPELGDQARLLLAAGHAAERDLVRLGHHLGVGVGEHARERLGKLPRQRALLELLGRRLQGGIDVRDDESADLAAVLDEVDLAPVGQRAGDEPGQAGQGGLVVERAREHPADLGEQRVLPGAVLGLGALGLRAPQLLGALVVLAPLLGDVAHHDQTDGAARPVHARDGGVERELGPVAAEADRARLDAVRDGPQPPARALEMGVEDAEEALGEEAIGGAAHRIGGGAAEQRLGRAVEADHTVRGVHAHDGDGRRADHRAQPGLARAQLGLDLAPGAGRRDQCLGQVVELADREGPQRRDLTLAHRPRAALDGPYDAPQPTGHEEGQTDGDQDQDPGGDVPPPARIPTQHHDRGHRTERETREE